MATNLINNADVQAGMGILLLLSIMQVQGRWMTRVIRFGYYCNINVMKDGHVMHYTFSCVFFHTGIYHFLTTLHREDTFPYAAHH